VVNEIPTACMKCFKPQVEGDISMDEHRPVLVCKSCKFQIAQMLNFLEYHGFELIMSTNSATGETEDVTAKRSAVAATETDVKAKKSS